MHCHSLASRLTKPEVRKAVFFGECATEPAALYELAKRRGMDFVTITDHDTIDGALRLADRPDFFISEELTGLAHPFWDVEERLTLRHRRRLAQLFPIWEVRSGYFGTELNAPAVAFREACGGVGIGGSDCHGGIHVGLTYTEAPSAGSPQEFLDHVRAGFVTAAGEQGNPWKLAQATAAIGLRSLPGGLGRAAGALASRAPRVPPREAPAPAAPAAPEPLADVVGL